MDFVSRQDIFESQSCLNATAICMIKDFDKVWTKHDDTIRTKGMTDAVYDDYKKLAEKYDVEFSKPRDTSKHLKLVDREGQSPTVH